MSPDLEYVLVGAPEVRTIGHSWLGVVAFDLPVSLLVLAAAQLALPGLAPLLAIGPGRPGRRGAWISERVDRWRLSWWPPRAFAQLSLAVVVGSASHVAVDHFTHGGGWGTARIGSLRATYSFLGSTHPGYRWLQYGWSLVGLAVLTIAFGRWFAAQQRADDRLHDRPPLRVHVDARLVAATGLLAVVGLGALENAWPVLPSKAQLQGLGVSLILGGWRAAVLAGFCVGLALRACPGLLPPGRPERR